MRASAEQFDHQHSLHLPCITFPSLLAACGKIHKLFQHLAIRVSTSSRFLLLDFQLLAFQMFLRLNRKNTTFFFTSSSGLRVLEMQELLAPLQSLALFLGVWFNVYVILKNVAEILKLHKMKFEF